jgi:hypothetical protein
MSDFVHPGNKWAQLPVKYNESFWKKFRRHARCSPKTSVVVKVLGYCRLFKELYTQPNIAHIGL